MRAKSDGFVGSGLPFADRGEVHRHFVAGGGLVERQQVTTVVQDTDESAVLEWTGWIIRTDERRIDRNRVRETAVNCTASSALSPKAAGLDEAVTVASPAVPEINGVD